MQGSVDRLVKACSYIERRAESAELEPWDFERHHAAEEEQHKWKWGEREDSNKYVKQHMFKFASESTRPVSTPEHIYFDSDVEDGATRLVVPLLSLSLSLSLSLWALEALAAPRALGPILTLR